MLAPWNAPASAPDMMALAVADRARESAVLQCEWSAPPDAPFAKLESGGFVLDLSGASRRQIDAGDVAPRPLDAADRPEAVPGQGTARLQIVQNGAVTEHGDMASFAGDLTGRLASAKVRAVTVIGSWDGAARKMTARQVVVGVE